MSRRVGYSRALRWRRSLSRYGFAIDLLHIGEARVRGYRMVPRHCRGSLGYLTTVKVANELTVRDRVPSSYDGLAVYVLTPVTLSEELLSGLEPCEVCGKLLGRIVQRGIWLRAVEEGFGRVRGFFSKVFVSDVPEMQVGLRGCKGEECLVDVVPYVGFRPYSFGNELYLALYVRRKLVCNVTLEQLIERGFDVRGEIVCVYSRELNMRVCFEASNVVRRDEVFEAAISTSVNVLSAVLSRDVVEKALNTSDKLIEATPLSTTLTKLFRFKNSTHLYIPPQLARLAPRISSLEKRVNLTIDPVTRRCIVLNFLESIGCVENRRFLVEIPGTEYCLVAEFIGGV